jgi:FimV-like protein
MNILIEIQKAADHFKSTQLRNKKVRRDQIVEDIGEPKLVKKKISKKKVLKKKVAKKTISKTKKEESQNEKEAMKELIEDEHISQNDLARTLMASGDNKKAIEVITNVINTGTEDEKHEARLLYMQIRK